MVGEFQFKNRKTKHNLDFLSYLFSRKILVFSLIFIAFLFSFGCVKIASGAFTPYINYQGKLLDSGGSPVANGDYNMSFRLCADSGCASVLWSEDRINANKVSVSSGLFSVSLGELADLSGLDFNQEIYLELSVGGTGVPSWETLLPRKILGAVPNAFNSQKFDGLATTSFMRSDVTNTSAIITTLTSTNIFSDNASITSVTSTNLFSGIINALSAIFDSLTATLANITTLVFGDATGNNLAVTNLNVTSTANIKDLNASSSVVINSTSTNFYSSNAVITGGAIASSTISGLNVDNFSTSTVSQWTNDAGYLTTSTGLTVANFASPNISQWTNDSGYLTSYVETDPIFMSASTSLPYQPIGSYLTVESDPIWLAASSSYLTTSSAASIYQPIGSYLIAESDPIWSAVSSSYLTVADASATYGSFAYNSSTFLTVASATATYLTQATAASTYLTQANAASTYLAINAASTTLWDTAYLWGDHSSAGYLTTSSNLTVANFASPNISQWTNDSGYLTSYVETDPIFMAASTSLPYQPIGSYLTVESDPIWLAASTSYANLSVNNTFTGENTFTATNTFATTTFSGNVGIGTTTPTKDLTVNGEVLSYNSFSSSTYDYNSTVLLGSLFNGQDVFGPESDPPDFHIGVYSNVTSTDYDGDEGIIAGIGLYGKANLIGVFGDSGFIGGLFRGGTYGIDVESSADSSVAGNFDVSGTSSIGIRVDADSEATNATGISIDLNDGSYGLKVDNGSSTGYAIYSQTGLNYFEGNVGIGTINPQTKLSVVGTSTFQGDISVSGGLLDSSGNFGTNGQILLSTGTSTLWVSTSTLGFVGGSSQWLDSGSDIYFSAGNVGIGTTSPMSKFSVVGESSFNNTINFTYGEVTDVFESEVKYGTVNTVNFMGMEAPFASGLYVAVSGEPTTIPPIGIMSNNYVGFASFNQEYDGGTGAILLGGAESTGLQISADSYGIDMTVGLSSDFGESARTNPMMMNTYLYPNQGGYGWKLMIEDDYASTTNPNYYNTYGAYLEGNGHGTGLFMSDFSTGINLDLADGAYGLRVDNGSSTGYAIYSETGLNYFGGNVGIGTSTPQYNLTIASSSNWLSMSRSDGYGLWFDWEESTIDYPLISGLASSTAILGGDLSAVGLKDRAVIVGDSEPNLSFSNYTGILSSLATIAFNTDTEIINFTGAKDYDWFDYDTGESQFVRFDAENLQVMVGTTTPYTATTSLTVSGSLYADHIYTSGNSFYMNGTKVIGSDETNLNFYADSGQNLKLTSVNGALQLLNTGSGGINLNSSSSLAVYGSTVDITGTNSLVVQTTGNSHGLTLQTNGNASNIGINANGTNSSVDLYATADISLTAPALTLTGTTGLTGGLTVSGATTINNNLTATGTVTFSGLTSGLLWSTNGVISSVATNTLGIISSQWIANGSDIYYGVGNVGIGSSSPSSKLSVGGNAYIGGNLTATGTLAITGTATSTFAGTIAVSGNGTSTFAGGINITSGCFAINGVCIEAGGTGTSQWTTVGSDIYYATGKIAVGTTTFSTSTLTVYGGADFLPNFNTLLSSQDLNDSTGENISAVRVVGNYAYVVGINLEGTASNQEFIIFDISNRASPVAVGGLNLDAQVKSIYIRGKYAYLGGNAIVGTDDLAIYDISSSTNPTYVGGIQLDQGVISLDVRDHYAYVADYDSTGNDLKILDISSSTNITLLGGYDGACNGFSKVSAYSDNYMIASGYYNCSGFGGASQSLIVFDVSDPTNPTPISGYNTGGSSGQDLDFYIYKNRIHILTYASSTAEVQVLDIKNPSSPTYLNSYDIYSSAGTIGASPSTIVVSNGYAFISVSNTNGDDLLALDLSNPYNISLVISSNTGNSGSSNLIVSDGYLYMVNNPYGYLNIYDLGGIKTVTADIGSLYSQDLSVDNFSSLGIANFLNSVYMSDIRSAEGLVEFNTNRVALNSFNATAGSTGVLSFNELLANGSNYVGFKAPDSLAINTVWTLPTSDGNINSFLTTDGSGNLSWGELAVGATAFLSEVNFISTPATAQAWSNMPLAETEFAGAIYTRKQVNMTNYTQFRLVSNQSVVGYSTAYLQAEYSIDGGSNWSNLEDTITGADLLSDTTGLHYGAWGYIANGAKTDVLIRIVGYGGNGTADPAWRQLSIQFKGYAGSQWASETGGNISYASGSVSIGTSTAGDFNLRLASTTNWLEMTNGGDVYTRFSTLASNIGNIPLLSSQGDTSGVLGVDVSGIFVKNNMYLLGIDNNPIFNFATMDGNNIDANTYVGFDGTNFVFSGGASAYTWLDSDDENIIVSINTTNGNIYSSALNSNGTVYSNNGILTNVNPSSMSYKSEIVSSTLNIDALLGLQVKSFTWNSNGQADFGLIAEEVRDALPELYMDDGTTKGYRADHLSFYLLQIAQRQDTQLKVLLNDYDNRTTTTVSPTQELVVADTPISNSNNFENLSVNSAATFYGTITVIGEAGFTSKVIFKDDVEIEGKLYLDKDQVGTTILPIGTTSTIVIFDKPFKVIPKVVANLNYSTSSLFVRYAIAEKTSSSFMIIIDSPVAEELSFDWLAIGLRTSADQFRDLINDDNNNITSPDSILVIDDASSTPDGDNVSISVPEDMGEPEVLGDGGLVESEGENNEAVDDIDSIETDDEIENNTETTQNEGELDSNTDSVNINVVDNSASESVVPDSMNLGDSESVADSNNDLVSPIIEAVVSVE